MPFTGCLLFPTSPHLQINYRHVHAHPRLSFGGAPLKTLSCCAYSISVQGTSFAYLLEATALGINLAFLSLSLTTTKSCQICP